MASGVEVPKAKLSSGPGEQIFVGVSYCGVLMPVNYQMHLRGSLVLFCVIIF